MKLGTIDCYVTIHIQGHQPSKEILRRYVSGKRNRSVRIGPYLNIVNPAVGVLTSTLSLESLDLEIFLLPYEQFKLLYSSFDLTDNPTCNVSGQIKMELFQH